MSYPKIHGGMILDGSLNEALLTPELQAKINDLKAQQDAILQSMSTDTERLDAFNQLTTAFTDADQTLEGALTALLNTATTRIGDEEDRAAAAEAAIQAALDSLTGQVSAITPAYTAAISAEQDRAEAAEAALQAAIDGVSATVATIETDLADLSARVDAVEAAVAGKLDVSKIREGELLIGAVDGTNTVFRVPEAYVPGTLRVYRTGVILWERAGAFTVSESDPQELTMSFTPDAGPYGVDDMCCSYIAA